MYVSYFSIQHMQGGVTSSQGKVLTVVMSYLNAHACTHTYIHMHAHTLGCGDKTELLVKFVVTHFYREQSSIKAIALHPRLPFVAIGRQVRERERERERERVCLWCACV